MGLGRSLPESQDAAGVLHLPCVVFLDSAPNVSRRGARVHVACAACFLAAPVFAGGVAVEWQPSCSCVRLPGRTGQCTGGSASGRGGHPGGVGGWKSKYNWRITLLQLSPPARAEEPMQPVDPSARAGRSLRVPNAHAPAASPGRLPEGLKQAGALASAESCIGYAWRIMSGSRGRLLRIAIGWMMCPGRPSCRAAVNPAALTAARRTASRRRLPNGTRTFTRAEASHPV
jgi:hypothetical protein